MNILQNATVIPGQGPPPINFIQALVAFGTIAPIYVYGRNPNKDDIMGLIKPILAPSGWANDQQRLAALLTALLFDAGFESSWVWDMGVDMEAGAATGRPTSEWEAGAWQVSANSMSFDPTLREIVQAHCNGAVDPEPFQAAMKADRLFAIHYVAVLFRCNTKWSGPCDSGHLIKALENSGNGITAMNAFQELLTSQLPS